MCVCVVHAHLICNGHQDVMESSEILSISHGGTAPRYVDIVPLPLLLPNIGVASVWFAWIKHPIVIAMKRDIEHPVKEEWGGRGWGGERGDVGGVPEYIGYDTTSDCKSVYHIL